MYQVTPSRGINNGMKHNHRLRYIAAFLVIVATTNALRTTGAKEPPPVSATPGLFTEKPANGPFVRVDNGYMAPYTENIPGTDITFEMIPIPGGEFLMGSPPNEAERNDDEGPQVRVTVEPFWMGKCEVGWGKYKSFMAMYDVFKKLQTLLANRGKGGGEGG